MSRLRQTPSGWTQRDLPMGLVLLFVLLQGCAARLPELPFGHQVRTAIGPFALRYGAKDAGSAEQVTRALAAVAPRLARWGGLRSPVTVHLLPSHEALERAVNREGYAWLRAWARYDEIFLQAPGTWSTSGATQESLEDLLLHELVHCLMYQAAATKEDWTTKQIPLWFREGMASFTAGQGHRWPGPEALARFYAAHPEADPGRNPEALYQQESDIVYGVAHHAFAFLVRRYGEERVVSVLENMQRGLHFPDAFTAAIGLSSERFFAEFERSIRLRSFRRRPPHPHRHLPGEQRPDAPASE